VNTLELIPSGSPGSAAVTCAWPAQPGSSAEIQTEIGWSMIELGAAASAAKDFLRIIAAGYLADRTVSRPQLALTRDLHIIVQVEQPQTWPESLLDRIADLLHWLSGDNWRITLTQADPGPEHTRPATAAGQSETVSLLSGGLDSLCGALLQLNHTGTTVFLGHRDSSTAIRRAQETIRTDLLARRPDFSYLRFAFRPLLPRREPTPRTRSLLFMAMAVVLASGRGATRILVPENGFTSINPPLEPSRGGPLTTRSTHPWTFFLLQEVLDALPLAGMTISNPHAAMTKGELVAAALQPGSAADLAVAAVTVSCAKLNAGRLPGANPNLNCGLCIACFVRRGAFAAAGRPDRTAYLATTLTGSSLAQLRHLRRHDVAATRHAADAGLDEFRVLASGLWPPHTDFDAVLELCNRGLEEIALVAV
jgi:hypothetical protein